MPEQPAEGTDPSVAQPPKTDCLKMSAFRRWVPPVGVYVYRKPFRMLNYFQRVSIIALLFFGEPLCAQVSDNQLPPVQWTRSRDTDIKHIALNLTFNWSKKQAQGTATIQLNTLRTTRTIALDAAMLTIQSITLANGNMLQFDYDGSVADGALKIKLDREYIMGEEIVILIRYQTNWVNAIDPNALSGSNGKGLRFSMPTYNDPTKPKEIWSMGDPQSNRYWFPGYDSPNDLRTTEFTATVDSPLMVISNGNLIETRTNPDSTRTFHWRMDTPYANHLTAFVVGEYVDITQEYNGIVLHNYSYPREQEATAASVVRLPDMIKFFSEKTGVRYPHPSYAQAFVQDLPWGLGYNMLSLQSENMVDDKGTHDDFLYLWDPLEGETLANQWFGNYVSPRDWKDIWLSKGFSIYFSRLYNEYKNGKEEFLLYQPSGNDLNTYVWEWHAGVRHPLVTRNYESPLVFASYDNQPTLKGSLVLHMLRKHLGDERWWKVINRYLKTHANQLVTTEDFRVAVEEASGEPMDWFFDQWIYKAGHPVFEITKKYNASEKQLTITVKQTQKIDSTNYYPQVAFFKGKVDIEIDNRIETVWLEAREENSFVFKVKEEPKLVNFDYEGTWIKEIKFEKTLAELLYQVVNDTDVTGRQWAMMQLSTLAKDDKTLAADKNRIYEAYRTVIQSNSYWRVRWTALRQLQGLVAPLSKTEPVKLDEATISLLLKLIRTEKSWLRASAIGFLGMTRNVKYAPIYMDALRDSSDRVVNQAAQALGKSKSKKAFQALVNLVHRPSWKNQSLISSLNGLRELGDPRGYEVAYKSLGDLNLLRWRLPNGSVWDFRVFAVETIVKLGRAHEAYPLLLQHFNQSMAENDLEGIFNNTLLITNLGDTRGEEIFPRLREKYKNDSNALAAVDQFENQFRSAIR